MLGDTSMRATPDKWGKQIVEIYNYLKADAIIAERNYGGEMVRPGD